MAIPHGFIQELLNRVDVVEVVGRYVQLKKTGANLSGLCPFHSEKTPSFTVSPSKQFYHCFGCGKSGDAVNFLMEHNGLGFVEAVQDLAAQHGMQVPDDRTSPQDRARAEAQRQKQTTLSDVLEKAAASYKKQLKTNAQAIDYLKQRGLTGAIAQRFGIGYAPAGWRHLSTVFPDYTSPLLEESGLVIHHRNEAAASSHSEHANPAEHPEQRQEQRPEQRSSESRYDRFRHRIMFPIRNIKGQYIGFGGRVLGDEKPKYLNSPETPVFSKGRELYGLFEARQDLRQHGFALVTEGYMDVVALAQLGFGNAVATLGTACTSDHVRKLFRYTDSIVFSFDGDTAGRNAARKALQAALPYASDTRSVKFLFLPEQHDPDSFIRAEGSDAFADAVKGAVPLSRFLLEAAAEDCDMETAEGRSHFAANARPLWQLLPPGTLAQQLLGEIAAQVQIGVHELEQLWDIRRAPRRSYEKKSYPRPTDGHYSPKRPEKAAPPRRHLRGQPASRASRALQIVLTEASAWDRLSQDEHVLLCDLPAPLGPLFTWLAGQALDHGPQPWSALREALRGHEHEDWAVEEVQKLPPDIVSEPDELQGILRTERREQLKRRMDAALAGGDMARYQALLRELAEPPPPAPA